MNVYDFDQTVYYPDSSYSFVMFSLRRYPRAVLRCLPDDIRLIYGCLRGSSSVQTLKENVFSFLRYIDDVDALVADFWQKNRHRIAPWYIQQAREDDLIISASPEFLLRPIADELGVSLIATPMDKHSGVILGVNCHDAEKVRRFNVEYPGTHVEKFYSDSLSDAPMAALADKAYIVKKDRICPWPDQK